MASRRTRRLLKTRGEVAFGGDGDAQPARRLVIATRNLETDEIWIEIRMAGELVERIGYDDWDQAQVDAVRMLLAVAPGGWVKESLDG